MKKQNISGYTRLVGFFASPARHSISPKMHNLAFDHLGIDAVYLAFDIEENDFETAIQSISSLNMLGANVSMPYKQTALTLMDELSDSAKLIGAINTIVYKEGKLIGHNTDGIGFIASLKENKVTYIGKTITVLGAGGAAIAMICQAALDGVKKIHVFNRKNERYLQFYKKIPEIVERTGCQVILHDLEDDGLLNGCILESDILVNATSIGMVENRSPIYNEAVFHPNLIVYDAIYEPKETKLLQQAKIKGCLTINGLGMLIYQGAAAFELWTQKKMPVELIKEKIMNEKEGK